MNKKMRELLALIEQKTIQARAFMDGENKDVNKASELMTEVKDLQKEYEVEKELYEAEKDKNIPEETAKTVVTEKKQEHTLAKMARMGFKTMSEGVLVDGGYTVPEDIQTRINNYRDAKFSLRQLVRVENVTTESGARTFKKRVANSGFTKVAEGGKFGTKQTPQFERLEYKIEKYGDVFPVTNELLKDSDANIEQVIVEWIGDGARITDNVNILEVAKTFTAKTLTKAGALDEIKAILNVDLGQAYKGTSVLVTNDNGLQFLDTLKDSDGNYVLSASPADPMAMRLSAGATTIAVRVIPNADLPNDGTKIPFYIGDFMEAIALFDRQSVTIDSTTVGAVGTLNAFEQDLTLWRALLREDVVKRDANALYFAQLDTAGE